MHLFLIAGVPISFIYLLVLRDEAGEPPSLIGVAALRGVAAYFVEIIGLLLIQRYVTRPYGGYGAYIYSAGYDFGIGLVGTFLLYLWFTPGVRGLTGRERRLSLLSFMAGTLTAAGLGDLFLRSEYFGVYELFLLPGLRVAGMILVPILYRLYVEETFWVRGLYLAGIILLPFFFAGVYFLVSLYLFVPALLAAAGVFGVSWLIVLVGSRRSAVRRR